MTDTLKARFAPSPTGRLHLGNVRTALFNWLLAQRDHGIFLLRFEDTDLERSAAEYEPLMQEDLRWLGLHWQEGPVVGGPHAPYRQSERGDIYRRYFDELEGKGLVYSCFCTPQELQLARKAQLAAGQPPRYPGTCAHLTSEQIAAKRAKGMQPTLRFRVPSDRTLEFTDLARGPQRFQCNDIGDFVVRRSDGTPAFFFSNAVDDALMGVTHVLRGEDHLTNTPRQILILEALAMPVPHYAHTAMLVGDDGSPLSKRHGSRSIAELRGEGFLPGAVANYLARLGHHYENDGWMEPPQLAAGFAFERLGRSPARYEESQLRHWQKEALAHSSDEALWQWLSRRDYGDGQRIEDLVADDARLAFVRAVRENMEMPADGFLWAQRLFTQALALSPDALVAVREAGPEFFRAAVALVDESPQDFKAFAKAVGEAAGVKGKALFMPLRAALTGETHGPEMAQIWTIMGQERIRQRLQSAYERCVADE